MRLITKLIKFLEDLTLLTLRVFPAELAKNITLRLLKLIYSLNLIGLFASGNIENSKINLEYQGYQQESYVQKNNNQTLEWIGNLSILDLIFNHGFDVSKI